MRGALAAHGADRRRAVTLFIGPEGGFSPREIEQARERGIVPVTLGPRVLRAETAAVVATALAIAECRVRNAE